MGGGPRADVVLVVPIAPADTGNGLAMRAGMWLECLAARAAVDLVVVPVSGSVGVTDWARNIAERVHLVEVPTAPDDARAHTTAQLADPLLRERLALTHPHPERVRRAPASLATALATRLGDRSPGVVVTMREYLAPLGIHLTAKIGADRVVVDLDDDAEAVLRDLGHRAEADAYGRLARAWLPDADAVTAASPTEARRMSRRYRLDVTTVPNAIRLPSVPPAPPPGRGRVLFVGNLTYDPNIAAATELVDEILPRIRSDVPGASVTLVGSTDRRVDVLGDRAGVVITGAVADVAPFYEQADLVVVALRAGGGTRLKVLESMAHRRPVVATPAAIDGLALGSDDVAVADDVAALASAAVDLLRDRPAALAIAESAFATVSRRHTIEAVAPKVRQVAFGEPYQIE